MDIITQLENEIFKTSSEEESFEELVTCLKKQNQIDYYDFIFKRNILEKTPYIKGLARVLKILFISFARRNLLYPTRIIPKIDIFPELLEILNNEDVLNDEITFDDFCNYFTNIIGSINNNKKSNRDTKGYFQYQDNEVHLFTYFMIGNKASLLTIDDIVNGYFNNDGIIKILSSAILVDLKSGPHYSSVTSIFHFFIHDFGHVKLMISNTEKLIELNYFNEYKDLYLLCKEQGNLCFLHRYCAFLFFARFHENWLEKKNSNILNVDTFLENVLNNISALDFEDVDYCFKWIIKSYDFDILSMEKLSQIKTMNHNLHYTTNQHEWMKMMIKEIPLVFKFLHNKFMEDIREYLNKLNNL